MSSEHWCTIESDPGVFTSLIESFGVKNAELSELWSLDDDSLSNLGKVYGLIFLFKWQKESADSASSSPSTAVALEGDDIPVDLFFAQQVTANACATQAILSVLLNAAPSDDDIKNVDKEEGELDLGPVLSNFKSFTSSFPPDLRGEAVGASEEIRTAHNSFARRDAFLSENKERIATENDDVFHFVAYVPHSSDRHVYELDGLKKGPIRTGSYADKVDAEGDSAWLSVAKKAIQERIEKYAGNEIKFNLMAVVKDKRTYLRKKHAQFKEAGLDDESDEIMAIQTQLEDEEQKRRQWKIENDRRRHNYLPFCVELLKALASTGKLPELTKKANERHLAKRRKAMTDKFMAAGGIQR